MDVGKRARASRTACAGVLHRRPLRLRHSPRPGVVVVDEFAGVAVIGFQSSRDLPHPGHVHSGGQDCEVEEAGIGHHLDQIAAQAVFRSQETDGNIIPTFGTDLGDDEEAAFGHVFDVEAGRRGRQFVGGGAFAGEAGLADLFDAFHGQGHFAELVRGAIAEPEAPAFDAVDELLGTEPAFEVGGGLGFELKKLVFLLGGEEVVSAVDGFVADADFGNVAEGFGAVGEGAVGTFHQIGADVGGVDGGGAFGVLVIGEGFAGDVERGEADDDDVDVGLAACLAFPGEGAVGEVDFDAVFLEEGVPESTGLFALANGVGGDKGGDHLRAAHVVRRLEIPAGDKIELSGVVDAVGNGGHVGALPGGLVFSAHKGRVAEDVGAVFGGGGGISSRFARRLQRGCGGFF